MCGDGIFPAFFILNGERCREQSGEKEYFAGVVIGLMADVNH
jgi:hypothetical protein